jgi:hypothetical protein
MPFQKHGLHLPLVDHESKTAGRREGVLQVEGVSTYIYEGLSYCNDVERIVSWLDVCL